MSIDRNTEIFVRVTPKTLKFGVFRHAVSTELEQQREAEFLEEGFSFLLSFPME